MVGLSREDIIGLYSRNKDIFHSNRLKESFKAMETIKVRYSAEIPDGLTGIIEYPNGDKCWLKDGKLHRIDGPACEYSDGTKKWFKEDKCHRLDGPAVEYTNGTKFWYKKGCLHRLDGPAIEYADGSKSWYKEDKLHREDGPAIELANGSKTWYVEGILYSEKDFNKKIEELKSEKTMEIKSKEIKQPETNIKTETGFHHSLSGPAVVFDDINKPDEYWVYGVQIFSEELFNAVKTFFDQNDGLDVKRFKSDSDYLVWSNSPERDTFTGIVVCVENKSFDKYVEGCLSSNKGYAQIIADDVAPIFRYALKGDRLNSSKVWKSKKDGVFENDYERIREEISLPKTEYISNFAHNSRTTIGKTTIKLFDDFNYISYTFDKKRNFIFKEYFNENWELSSEKEFLSEKDQAFKMFETKFLSEREQLSKLGFKISRLKVFRNKTFVELYEHPKTKAKVIVDNFFGNLEYKCDLNGEIFITYSLEELKEFLQKDYNEIKFISIFGKNSQVKYKLYYSINDELFLTKSQFGNWEITIPSLGIVPIPAIVSTNIHFKKYLISFIEDSNLNTTPEKLIKQIAENVPEFKEYLEGQKTTPTLTISAKPLFSTKTKEIAKRVAVKRISNIVASLVIQQVFPKVNKAEHQKIKEFFKTEAGVGLVKVLTAQLLPMLEQHLPEKYQHVYRTIAEEFDIQSKVDFSDGVLDLILEKVELTSPFISFNFLENLKEDSTGVRVNPLALESPNPDFQAELNAQTTTKEEVSAKG